MIRSYPPLTRRLFPCLLCGALFLGAAEAQADALSDARSEGAANMVLSLNPQLANDTLTVKVANARAVLSGDVDSEESKTLAAQLVQAVTGAEAIDNRLAVAPDLAERPPVKPPRLIQLDDLSLAAAIRSRLSWSVATADSPVEVSVDGGVVTLKGQASTAQAKEWAGTLAMGTAGAIVVNNLISLRAADTGTTEAETQAKRPDEGVSDAWIASKVARSFQYERSLDAQRLEVKAKDGIVTLAGAVDSQSQRTHAMAIAQQIRGVRGVDADLVKVASKPVS